MEMQTFFISAKTSKLYSPPSRPVPEAFTPPNGWRRSRTFWVFTNTMPASILRARRSTLLTSWVQMYDARPYSTSLARRSPSASSLNGSRHATGPKISSCATRMRLSTSASTVGRRKLPPFRCAGRSAGLSGPPASRVAPSSMPRRI